nr:GntR family transcriptional regulator [Candidatus Pantoea persica]
MLEEKQMIMPQPRSGYFVTPRKAAPPVPALTRPVEITQWESVLDLLDSRQKANVLQLGSGLPNLTQPIIKPLWKILGR